MSDDEGDAPKAKSEVPQPLNNFGVSALLHYAASSGDIEECYRLIVEEGASVHSLNANRSTPLHIAALKGYYTMVEMLLEQRADVNRKESVEIGGYIPLIHSVKGNHLQISELLLAHGSDPNEADADGLTPLHYCGRISDHDAMARLLLSKGGDPTRLDKDGFNCAYWAKECGNKSFLKIKNIPEVEAPDVESLVLKLLEKKNAYYEKLNGGKKEDDGGGKKKKKKKK